MCQNHRRWDARHERTGNQPPPLLGGAALAAPAVVGLGGLVGRGRGRRRRRRTARRPARRPRRATASFAHATFAAGRDGRPPRQRLRPDRAPARLRLRQDAPAGQRPGPARMGDRRPGQGDRSRPGVKYEAWTYNGRVPGPTLRAREGERLRIRFVNGSEHPHTMHFHGIHPALDGRDAGDRRGPRRRPDRAGREPSPTNSTPRPSASTSTTATSPRSPPTSPAASTAPSSSTRRRGGPKPTRW